MESFYRSFLTPEVKLLGYRLKPYCFGHQVILKALESPFLLGDRDVTPPDLIVAVKVCSLSYPFEPDIDFTFLDKVKANFLNYRPTHFFKLCILFQQYLNEHNQCPEYWHNTEGTGNSVSAPDELFYISSLVKNGIPLKDAWNMSIGLATWLNASFFELSGCEARYTDPIDDDLNPPDISELTEDQIYEQAVKDLGEERAKILMKLRRENVS